MTTSVIPAIPDTSAASATQQQLAMKFLLLLGCYFSLHILLRVLISDALDYDEAEQALLGQWLLAGYTEQPPLYTWVQYFLFELFGKNVFAVSLLKNCLLFLTYVFVFLSGREILRDTRLAILASCSLLLIPQIGWESQRDMTHTTLVVCAASASLWQSLRLVKKQNLINYCVFGLLLSVGILGKANFALFIATLLVALATFSEGRKVLLSPKIVVSILIMVVVTGSYFLWMYENQDIVFSVTHKFKRAVESYQLQGVISLFVKSFLFLTPMWLICLLVFPAGFGRNQNPETGFHQQFIKRYILTLFLILLATILVFKVTYVKDRWLQPLLFAAPIFFFSRLDPAKIYPRRFKLFLKVISIAAIAVFIAFSIRVAGASYIHSFCRMNYPFTAMAKDLRQTGFSDGLIISNNRFLAGNMRIQFPGSTALIPGYRFESRTTVDGFSAAAVIWEADRSPAMPPELASFLTKTYNIVPTDYPVNYFQHKYKYGRTETVKFALMQFPLPANPVK
jgi:4-amino-4-deoxy-L-arabinose transferase-like glycosyltransferase